MPLQPHVGLAGFPEFSGGFAVVVVAFKAACSRCSLLFSLCLHPSLTGLQGRATPSGCLAAIRCPTAVAALVRKLLLVVHASYNLPTRAQQHLLQSQHYITTTGLSRACESHGQERATGSTAELLFSKSLSVTLHIFSSWWNLGALSLTSIIHLKFSVLSYKKLRRGFF